MARGRNNRGDDDNYEVGYGKPPKNSQFRKGQSGNPKGRPRGSKEDKLVVSSRDSLARIIKNELFKTVRVNEANGPVDITYIEAIIRQMKLAAAKGNIRAQCKVIDLGMEAEAKLYDQWAEQFQNVLDYKLRAEADVRECKEKGLSTDHIIPHPDHIIIDFDSGMAWLVGPRTPEEKKEWDREKAYIKYAKENLSKFRADARKVKDPVERKLREQDIENDIAECERSARYMRTPRPLIFER